MATFSVKNIIDGNTIEITPNWKWGENSGSTVKIAGYNPPNATNAAFTVSKLNTLLMGKPIELKNPTEVSTNIITCHVFLNEVDISKYFPELQPA